MKRWGHVLSGVDPWGGWTFVEPGGVPEQCSTCHWLDPELVNTHVPSAGHLSEVVREVLRDEVVSAFDVTLVFGEVFRDRLLRLGVAETAFRDLPGGFVTFDYCTLPTASFRESAEGVERCVACGRPRVVKRDYGPNGASYVVDDPGDEVLVRDLQRTGRGRLRGWSVFVSDWAYGELGWPRHSWDVFVDRVD